MSIIIQSITSKFSELLQMINTMSTYITQPDVICLQEIWRFPDTVSFFLPGYHPFIYKQRNFAQGGGVGLFIKLNLKYK